MRWSKGEKTRGRGKSLKGALDYYLHDKGTMETAHRVGFVRMLNLVTKDPNQAWREMMLTAESADQLKVAAGFKPSAKKNEKPVYCFSLNWHPDDHPSKQHMLETALEVVKMLRADQHQVVIVEHLDEPHPHVHITINMIHPETGMSLSTRVEKNTPAPLYKDEERLQEFCRAYEVRMGVIRSPTTHAYYEAIEQGQPPPKRVKTPKHHNDPVIKAAIANDNRAARERAQAIQVEMRSYTARLKATQDDAFKRRRTEQRALWNDFRTARQAIRSRHKFEIDRIYKHKRNRHALPLSIQGFRDWRETREWKKLMERLKAEKRRFEYRERTLLGFVTNAIAVIRPSMQRTGKGLLPMLFALLVSGEQRRQLLAAKHGLATRALSDKQFGKRHTRAEKIKIVRDAQLEALSRAYDLQKQALDQRHAQQIAAQKAEWSALSVERKRLWQEWEQEFGPRQTQRQGQGSGSNSGDRQASARPRRTFAETASKKPAQAPDSPVRKKFEDKAAPKPEPDSPKPWRQRRSAAERKADGSYKPRQRSPKPKM
jgi:Relaxase/Mobilisation nuclease domain